MRRLLVPLVLLATTALYPSDAQALPILGFLGGALFSVTGIVTPALGFGGVGAGLSFGTFLTSGFGSLLISVAATAAQYLLQKKPQAPSVESARVNVRIGEPQRWLHAGRTRAGGAAVFGEFDANGNFWYILVHGDSPLRNTVHVVLAEIPVELDEDGWVTTAEFTETQEVGGTPVFRIWTTTFTPDDPVPPAIADFKAAFPEWTDDHLLVGTTYSVVRCRALEVEERYKVMVWRGPFGLGEPGVSIIGDWDYIYDPRDEAQDIDDRATWGTSRNSALIWAWFRTHPWGRNKPLASINWAKVGEQATICDQTETDKNGGTAPRYVCGISVPDEKERHVAEAEILMSADAVIMHDAAGLAYPMVGHYAAPTLTLSRKRDIMAMASREATNGESETDGVIVKYIEPEFLFVAQPAAAWINPLYFEEGRTPRFLTIEVLACQNHNQAVRLAKAMGLRTQSRYRLAPTVGLRGLMARRERIVDLQYDDTFAGPHEIATPVALDEAGITSAFGLVPVDANRWTLLEGEEGDKPAPATPIEHDGTLPLPSGVTLAAAFVPGSGGNSVRLEAVFDAPSRVDRRFEFQYRKAGDLAWRPMVVLMTDLLAYSDTVDDGATYQVQYRTVTLGGRASAWKTPPDTVVAVADPTPPVDLIGFGVVGGAGLFTVSFGTANDTHLRRVAIYRVPTGNPLVRATHLAATPAVAPGIAYSIPVTSAAGTIDVYAEPLNGSGLAGTLEGPVTVTVT